ncbi:hypothetical protein BSKO_01408 [Bryopsis sp. KO-2023]|nr:hypothetical protein BSKO_01408 [Bryopsis sp. KO-2023]
MLSLVMEEVLPRPESGLLKRMLRMAEVPMSKVEGCKEPIFNFRVASECHFSVGMIVVQDNNTGIEISGPVRISMQPTDGEKVDLEVNSERIDSDEHLTTSFWDMKNHSSELMTTMPATSPNSTSLIPIELVLGFNVKVKTSDDESVHEIAMRKTLLAKMRRGSAMDVEPRYHYSEDVVEFVLCELELIAMPSLLMFMRLSV